jgi:4-hydroxy-tetrahydrodipicolinate synthase
LSETSGHPEVAGLVSITHHSWEVAVKQAIEAERLGADGLMVLPPFFLGPSAEAVIYHCQQIASAVSIPLIVQYAPNQTGVKLMPDAFIRMHQQCPNVQYVKVETQPPGRYCDILHEQSGGQLATLVGYAGVQMPDVLARGAAGIQPGSAFTEIYVELYRQYERKQMDAFGELFTRLLPYISYWMQGVELSIKAQKVILKERGIIASDYCRHPGYKLDVKELRMIERFMSEFEQFFTA